MEVIFYTNTSEKNACRPNLINDVNYEGTLRPDAEQSVVTPSLLINVQPGDVTLFTKNYARIEDFGRYYHIENIVSVRDTLVRVELRSDPLASFFEEYGEQDVIIERAEDLYNLFLHDGQLPVEARTEYDKYVAASTPFTASSIIALCAGANAGGISGTTISDDYVADGVSNQFYLSQPYIESSIEVKLNGTSTTAWRLITGTTGSFISFTTTPQSGDTVKITYIAV